MTPVGVVEIAVMLGVKRATVDQWRQRKIFPDPKWTVGGRPAWEKSDIEEWARSRGPARSATVERTEVRIGPRPDARPTEVRSFLK